MPHEEGKEEKKGKREGKRNIYYIEKRGKEGKGTTGPDHSVFSQEGKRKKSETRWGGEGRNSFLLNRGGRKGREKVKSMRP